MNFLSLWSHRWRYPPFTFGFPAFYYTSGTEFIKFELHSWTIYCQFKFEPQLIKSWRLKKNSKWWFKFELVLGSSLIKFCPRVTWNMFLILLGTCTFTVNKCNHDICQLRLDFLTAVQGVSADTQVNCNFWSIF